MSAVSIATATPIPAIAGTAPGTDPAGPGDLAPGIKHLQVPAEFAASLAAAVAQGDADAVAFGNEHAPSERWMVPQWALLKLGFPPKDDAPELKVLHDIARHRTPDGIAAARYLSKHGLTDEWIKQLDDYLKKASPAQARAARKLLHDSLMMVNEVTQTAKASSMRKRPFTVDPSLELAVDKPGNNPSYPSGHTSAAYAACLVLAHLMPDRKAEFLGMAHEAGWARLYAGVHFPSDVLAGAKLASTVTSYLVRHSAARPILGTGHNTGTGSGNIPGPRQALKGAAKLAGTPIGAGAVMGLGQPGS